MQSEICAFVLMNTVHFCNRLHEEISQSIVQQGGQTGNRNCGQCRCFMYFHVVNLESKWFCIVLHFSFGVVIPILAYCSCLYLPNSVMELKLWNYHFPTLPLKTIPRATEARWAACVHWRTSPFSIPAPVLTGQSSRMACGASAIDAGSHLFFLSCLQFPAK